MQFRDLKRQYEHLKPQMDAAMQAVLDDAAYIAGNQVTQLEQELAAYVGAKHCVTCGNGTDALRIVLMAWGVGKGDAVFVPDLTFFASGEAPALEGATPVFVDVDPDTFNIDPAKLEQAVAAVKEEGKYTPKAVIAVDLYGLPAAYDALEPMCKRHGLLLLEDAAQGFGGRIGARRAGSFGDAAATSFFPAKPLGCYGDGGAVFTNNDETAALLRSYVVHGRGTSKYDNVRVGVNSRLDTLQAAVLLVKLHAFTAHELADVNSVAAWYDAAFAAAAGVGSLKLPVVPEGFFSSWAQYTVRLPVHTDRGAVQKALAQQGIPTMIYYPVPMRKQGAFEGTDSAGMYADCPVTDALCASILSVPMGPYVTREEVDMVARALLEACHCSE